MKLINISNNLIYILYVKDEQGNDKIVNLHPSDHVFTPTNEKTKSITLQGMKKNLAVLFDEEKPAHLDYFTPYKAEQLILKEEEFLESANEISIIDHTFQKEELQIVNEQEQLVSSYYHGLNVNILQEVPKNKNIDFNTSIILMFKEGMQVKEIAKKTGATKFFIKDLLKTYSKESGENLIIK